MDFKLFATVFMTVFLAELGDKTQLATFLFAADSSHNKLIVFLGASVALILTSALGVFAGTLVSEYVNPKTLHFIAGIGFIAIGIWMLFSNS